MFSYVPSYLETSIFKRSFNKTNIRVYQILATWFTCSSFCSAYVLQSNVLCMCGVGFNTVYNVLFLIQEVQSACWCFWIFDGLIDAWCAAEISEQWNKFVFCRRRVLNSCTFKQTWINLGIKWIEIQPLLNPLTQEINTRTYMLCEHVTEYIWYLMKTFHNFSICPSID